VKLINLLATTSDDIEHTINVFSLRSVLIASFLLIVLVLISSQVIKNKKRKNLKKPLFIAIVLAISIPSLLMTGSTIYVNTISDSKGPVHWHADIEFWVCGQEIELRDPYEFLSNKIGTSTYHEHDDKRIHLEGVVIDRERDASLEKFMRVTGGAIASNKLIIPTEPTLFEDDIDGDTSKGNPTVVQSFASLDDEGRTVLSMTNGDSCGGEELAEVQAFLFRYNEKDKTYQQIKLSEPAQYVIRDEPNVPPGDCVIVEFDSPKSRTDKLCQQYGVKDELRCTEFGVKTFDPRVCTLKESFDDTLQTETILPTANQEAL
jgi:hypothetical protein